MPDCMVAILVVILLLFNTIFADHYSTLGVRRNSNEHEIRRAYRRLALRYHPDRNHDNPEAEKKFVEITKSYEVLSDPKSRYLYDRFGDVSQASSGGSSFPSGTEDREFDVDFEEAFRQFDRAFSRQHTHSEQQFASAFTNSYGGRHVDTSTSPDDVLSSLFREFDADSRSEQRTFNFESERLHRHQHGSSGPRCHQSIKLVNGMVFTDTVCN